MESVGLAIENLTSPPVLAFVLGAVAVVVRSDLRLPDPIHTWLSTYLLLAIGLKGGHALKGVELGDIVLPVVATLALGLLIPVVVFVAGGRVLRLGVVDAGSVAAHYGSVSVVTFTAATVLASEAKVGLEPFMATLVALLEVPGIIVALLLVSMKGSGAGWRSAIHEVLTGRSILLLVGGLVMGVVATDAAFARVEPFFVASFSGILTLFLLDMGATAAARLKESKSLSARVIAFGVVVPLLLGVVGVCAGVAAGLSAGGSAVLGAMAASASYIAAPAAVRIALPEADTGLSLGLALGVTFPLNLTIGIPLYFLLAESIT
ncbi:MAG: sodium-dependent bicarbonate transport family permease [Microthrixaceae bacterium]